MPVVISQGALTDTRFSPTWRTSTGIRLTQRWMDYATIYRTQPAIASCVDLFARHIAQLGLHVFRRIGETDRQRIRDHPLARVLDQPNGWTDGYRLIYSTVADKKIYGNSFWLKAQPNPRLPMVLIRIPPQLVEVQGGLRADNYRINLYPDPMDVDPSNIVHFRSYNPDNPIAGLSPIEPLRLSLDADMASIERRRDMESNAGRQPVIIKRPKSAGDWGPEAARRFSERFTEAFRSPNGRTTPILEDDMELQLLSFNAEQSQWVQARELSWEECARRYHIPLSVLGLAGANSTFASVREFRKSLYVDTLGPDIAEFEGEIALQLFPDFANTEKMYVEFNVMQKLQGDFEEQADMLQKAIGRPWMTPDEGRGRLNLPSKGGNADQLAVPLNVDPSGEGAGVEPPAAEPPVPALPTTNGSTNGHVPALSR